MAQWAKTESRDRERHAEQEVAGDREHRAAKVQDRSLLEVLDEVHARRHSFLVVDTRSRGTFAQGHIEGAWCLPEAEIAALADALPRDRPLLLYGWSHAWHSSTPAALELAQRGFLVGEMEAGWDEWLSGGFPIHRAHATDARCSCSDG